jgi:hypothetical protein
VDAGACGDVAHAHPRPDVIHLLADARKPHRRLGARAVGDLAQRGEHIGYTALEEHLVVGTSPDDRQQP